MKICLRCKESKPEVEYRKTFMKSVGKYYLRSYCKTCLGRIKNESRMLNPRLHEKNKERLRKQYYRRKSSK